MQDSRSKLKVYQRSALVIASILLVVVIAQVLIGFPIPVLVMAPLSVLLLIALLAWIACFLVDRNNARWNAGGDAG